MKLHYMGRYDGKPENLPVQRQVEGAIPFREPSSEKLPRIINALSAVIVVVTGAILIARGGFQSFSIWGVLLSFATLIPHEFLHALCFKKDVYMYAALDKGMMFVVGPEDMSKKRFIILCLLPNIVFGFIPFLLFLLNPSLRILGSLGALAIAMGAGDYLNVYNAIVQVPRGGLIYAYRMSSYWYMPNKDSI